MPPTRAGLIATRYSLLSTRSSTERSSVRAFVRITSAASSRESPPTSVSHTNASMPSVAPIPKTNRRSFGSGMRPFRGERASSIYPIRRPRRSGRLSPRHYRDPRSTDARGGEGGVRRRESQSLECRRPNGFPSTRVAADNVSPRHQLQGRQERQRLFRRWSRHRHEGDRYHREVHSQLPLGGRPY